MMAAMRCGLLALGVTLAVGLGGCGSDVSVQYTNATTTERLNQIAENTSDTAGADETRDGSAADIAKQSTRPAKPRHY